MVPILKVTRQPPDNSDEYRQEFGYLGPALQVAVSRSRTQSGTPASSASSTLSSGKSAQCIHLGSLLEVVLKRVFIIHLGLGMTAARNNTIMMSGVSNSGQTAVARNQSGAGTSSAGNPTKYMLVSSRPSTPVQVISNLYTLIK